MSAPAPAMKVRRYATRPGLVTRSLWLSLIHGRARWRTFPIVAAWSAEIDRAEGAEVVLHGRLVLGYESFLPGYFGERSSIGPSISLSGAGSRLVAGDGVLVAHGVQINVAPGAQVSIGDRTYFNPNSRVLSAALIEIGSACAISWGVEIMDFDAHELVTDERPAASAAPVRLGDHVWVGARATILKGVEIGEGAVIGAGAVVTRPVPARTLAVGSPARVVREDVVWR